MSNKICGSNIRGCERMNRLRYFREREGMTQVELSKKSGVTQGDISRVEKQIKDLSGTRWKSLAKVLGCTVDELLGKE